MSATGLHFSVLKMGPNQGPAKILGDVVPAPFVETLQNYTAFINTTLITYRRVFFFLLGNYWVCFTSIHSYGTVSVNEVCTVRSVRELGIERGQGGIKGVTVYVYPHIHVYPRRLYPCNIEWPPLTYLLIRNYVCIDRHHSAIVTMVTAHETTCIKYRTLTRGLRDVNVQQYYLLIMSLCASNFRFHHSRCTSECHAYDTKVLSTELETAYTQSKSNLGGFTVSK